MWEKFGLCVKGKASHWSRMGKVDKDYRRKGEREQEERKITGQTTAGKANESVS